jgi:hypothetical protein
VKHELPTFPQHLSSPRCFRVAPLITNSLREYTPTKEFLNRTNGIKKKRCEILHDSDAHTKKDIYCINKHTYVVYKTFLALIYKQFLCYDVTITTGLLSRLHLQKQAVRLKITSDKKFCKISVGTINLVLTVPV